MRRIDFDGGWYADALPNGQYVVLYADGHMDSSVYGVVPPPPNDALRCLYPRLDPTNGAVFTGQEADEGNKMRPLHWDGSSWSILSDQSIPGVYPVIYKPSGEIVLNYGAADGTQGYRYVATDGRVVTGDETYSPTSQWTLFEWTELVPGSLVVGQGNDGGVIVWDNGVYRELVPESAGLCRFIHATATGVTDSDSFGLAFWGQTGVPTACYFGTLKELRELPVVEPVVVQPPPVIPTPPPQVVEPPSREPMQLPESVKSTIREFASVYSVPSGDGSEEWIESALRAVPGGWIHRLAQTIAARHGGDWGRKRASHDRPLSKESIALNRDGLHGWDLLAGASSGRPTLQTDSYHDLVAEGNQVFVPVEPFDHLDSLPVSPIVRPPLPFVASVSSFDWHLHRDGRWLDFLDSAGIRTLRLVVSSVFRRGSNLSEGREALIRGLDDLRARGFKATVTINTDTRERGLTLADCREHTRLTGEILAQYPDVVVCARLFNENTHGVESQFASDPSVLLELDALVPASVPLAWGANHGGEPVSAALAGGSWIAFHSDRSKTPEDNAAIMAEAQSRFGKPVVDDEPIGIYHEAQAGRRVNDPAWAERQARAAKSLGGTTLHLDAGIAADVNALDDVQRQAARRFAAVFSSAQSPDVEVPALPLPPSNNDHAKAGLLEKILRFILGLFR